MSSNTKSRWADNEEDAAIEARRKREKEERKRAKAENQRKLGDLENSRHQDTAAASTKANEVEVDPKESNGDVGRPAKRRRLSLESADETGGGPPSIRLLRFPALEWGPCRHVDNFEKLNHIEEGSYGWVSRAREIATGEVVALKKLKMDNSNDGFPVTGLREIQTLIESRHENIVNLREVVMGDSMSE